MLKKIFLVGIGGGIGSVLRFVVSLLIVRIRFSIFPLTTFVVNLLGCFFVGILVGLSLKNNWLDENVKIFFITGFCGGFTTFSSFSLENFQLYQAGNYRTLVLYILINIIVGCAAVLLGYILTEFF